STCIGLILKGYDDYEHNRKQFEKEYKKVEIPDGLKRPATEEIVSENGDAVSDEKVKQRRGLSNFWGKFKDGIIDLFKEEEDKHL
ncbi:MAG TPA: cell division protein FtsA, partial [Chitinophagaceae bacterium]|nr:cell division protein FtsA [Chitinophagaceae bacterium]